MSLRKSGNGNFFLCSMKRIIIQLLLCICVNAGYGQIVGISAEMEERLKAMEGLSLEVYMDGLYRAVGYGHRITERDPEWVYDLEHYDEITEETAEILFRLDMIHLVSPGLEVVRREIGGHYPSNVYDAMGSLIYNMGLEGLRSTEFYRLFRDGQHQEAFRLLLATKAEKEGLLERRYMELSVLVRNYDFSKGKYMAD